TSRVPATFTASAEVEPARSSFRVLLAARAVLPTVRVPTPDPPGATVPPVWTVTGVRSEEHTSELQSQSNLVCRLLLEKKTILLHTRLTVRPELGRVARLATRFRLALLSGYRRSLVSSLRHQQLALAMLLAVLMLNDHL